MVITHEFNLSTKGYCDIHNITEAVTGDGLVSLGIKSDSSNLVKYSSKEGAHAPQLVVEYGPPQPPEAEFEADLAYLVLEEFTQWLDQRQAHVLRQPADIVMGFNDRRRTTERGYRFNNIRV